MDIGRGKLVVEGNVVISLLIQFEKPYNLWRLKVKNKKQKQEVESAIKVSPYSYFLFPGTIYHCFIMFTNF